MNTSTNDEIMFDLDLGAESLAYLRDHTVGGAAVAPAALYPEMVLAMAADALGADVNTLRNVRFHTTLDLSATIVPSLQVVFQPEATNAASFWVFGTSPNAAQQLYVNGRALNDTPSFTRPISLALPPFAENYPEQIDRASHYEAMARRGITYGPGFQVIDAIWRGNGSAMVLLKLPTQLSADADIYELHPALLDGAFQSVAIARSSVLDSDDAYLPVGFEVLCYTSRLETPLWAEAVLVDDQSGSSFTADITLYDRNGVTVAEISRLAFRRIEQPPSTQQTVPRPTPVVAPDNEAEMLAAVWGEVLQLAQIAPDDDFFELGGDSLMASQIATRAQHLGFTFTPQQLLQHRTITGLLMATQETRNG